ncbi:MAG: Ig-like domain-containing protein [Anaerolineae bacterium]
MRRVLNSLLLIIIVTACNLGTAPATVVPTPDIPTVEILAPLNNQQVVEGVEFDFDIVARDGGAGVAMIELYVDSQLVNLALPVDEEAVPIFRTLMNWRADGVGRQLVEVIAYRENGQQSDPARINIEVMAREP